ncbi:MAG TPA: DUF2007 domain-containing protein [Longimicrobium sp.]|jgi:hypothetical protein
MSERWVVVRTCINDLEATMLRAELEASGIPVQVRGSGGILLPPLHSIGGIRLAVPESAAEDALALLRPFDDEGEEPPRAPPAGEVERPRTVSVDDEERSETGPADREERPRTRPAYGQELPRRRPPQ